MRDKETIEEKYICLPVEKIEKLMADAWNASEDHYINDILKIMATNEVNPRTPNKQEFIKAEILKLKQ